MIKKFNVNPRLKTSAKMSPFPFFLLSFILLTFNFSVYAVEVCPNVYGEDPLSPSRDSLLGRYIERTEARTVQRFFTETHESDEGVTRLVVNISADSYEHFNELFVNDSILWIFHDPNSRVINVSFDGRKGFMGRLNQDMRFTFPGAFLIPICLTHEEKARLKDFFSLASVVSQGHDYLLNPWLLKNEDEVPYMTVRNSQSFSLWFIRIPLATTFDRSVTRIRYQIPELSSSDQEKLMRVWAFPYKNHSLKELLGLEPFQEGRALDTPGQIASAILGNVSPDRVPTTFRYVEDHLVQLPTDFNIWIDLDFNPTGSLSEQMDKYNLFNNFFNHQKVINYEKSLR